MIAEVKLDLFRLIDSLPENLVVKLQAKVEEFVASEKVEAANGKSQNKQFSEIERLAIINEAAKQLTYKSDFEAYLRDFEESTQDRPLPFRED
jgi:hypothetical protein